jgi:hypothetical protein
MLTSELGLTRQKGSLIQFQETLPSHPGRGEVNGTAQYESALKDKLVFSCNDANLSLSDALSSDSIWRYLHPARRIFLKPSRFFFKQKNQNDSRTCDTVSPPHELPRHPVMILQYPDGLQNHSVQTNSLDLLP